MGIGTCEVEEGRERRRGREGGREGGKMEDERTRKAQEGASSRLPSLSSQVAEVDVFFVPALALRGVGYIECLCGAASMMWYIYNEVHTLYNMQGVCER